MTLIDGVIKVHLLQPISIQNWLIVSRLADRDNGNMLGGIKQPGRNQRYANEHNTQLNIAALISQVVKIAQLIKVKFHIWNRSNYRYQT